MPNTPHRIGVSIACFGGNAYRQFACNVYVFMKFMFSVYMTTILNLSFF